MLRNWDMYTVSTVAFVFANTQYSLLDHLNSHVYLYELAKDV